MAITQSIEARDRLVEVLRNDLVGPEPGSEDEREVLPQPPSRWYLCGFLVPHEGRDEDRRDETAEEDASLDGAMGGADDEADVERVSERKVYFPSSIGVSVLVPKGARTLSVDVTFGEYRPLDAERADVEEELADEELTDEELAERHANSDAPEDPKAKKKRREDRWARTPRAGRVEIALDNASVRAKRFAVEGLPKVTVVVSSRVVKPQATWGGAGLVAPGTRVVSIFLVNERAVGDGQRKDEAYLFQAALAVQCSERFVERPDVRGRASSSDWDEKVAELQYRDSVEYSVGHGVSTTARVDPDGRCRCVRTEWIPSADVEKVLPHEESSVVVSMDELARCTEAGSLSAALGALPAVYRPWIAKQRAAAVGSAERDAVRDALAARADRALARIEDGIALLDADPLARESFALANKVMAQQARRRRPRDFADGTKTPSWRLFQLAFILMNLRSIVDPRHEDRATVDLLFFPTGGGKTEAYLGLAAFTLVLRRLRNEGVSSAGVTVLMRYTLRLLTLDQLSRAATLVCALELERKAAPARLGRWPFEIGLLVGKAATPIRMGTKGDGREDTARAKTLAFQRDSGKNEPPIPLESCPWCQTPFTRDSFKLVPNNDVPTDLRVACASRDCAFDARNPLPIVAVDEPLYRRLPCFVIATVDKFANLPYVGRMGALFGKVDRYDASGFYGPCDLGLGELLPVPLPPPELVIQDELHLISGPLGTMVGIYETALDALCERSADDGQPVRPKIVASTATVRRAEEQIRALFARNGVEVFPPPGPDRRDSFFAVTVPVATAAARRYVGIAAQGRSLKVVLLRSYLALLSAGEKLFAQAKSSQKGNPVDPYMSLVGYFNSLRELGGSRRIVEDEVRVRLLRYSQRARLEGSASPFADRTIRDIVVELTSRESTAAISLAKSRLELPFIGTTKKQREQTVDVALATNMISVGLDITRLGLMVVLGQPKSTAEYIQATSRVGRDDARPGLVVTLLNIHRPRDRSHYERFVAYHQSFYRAVEATSVTPWSPRAVDRGLPAVVVALSRLGVAKLTRGSAAIEITRQRASADVAIKAVARRVRTSVRGPDTEATASRVEALSKSLLDSWSAVAKEQKKVGATLSYQRYEDEPGPQLLHGPLDEELARRDRDWKRFVARRSLRDVEPSVNLWMKRLDAGGDDDEPAAPPPTARRRGRRS
jgi:hypothetical protein